MAIETDAKTGIETGNQDKRWRSLVRNLVTLAKTPRWASAKPYRKAVLERAEKELAKPEIDTASGDVTITLPNKDAITIRFRVAMAASAMERTAKEFAEQAERAQTRARQEYFTGRADQAMTDAEALQEILRA